VLQEICSRSSFIYFVACIFGLFLKLRDGVFLAALRATAGSRRRLEEEDEGWKKEMRGM
jgi:hypothetical protein